MKRTPLARRAALARHGRIKARVPPEHGNPTYRSFIRDFPCHIPLCPERSECAHIKSRGAGGKDERNIVPLCRSHHREQHTIGIQSFAAKYGLDLPLIATAYFRLYEHATGGTP